MNLFGLKMLGLRRLLPSHSQANPPSSLKPLTKTFERPVMSSFPRSGTPGPPQEDDDDILVLRQIRYQFERNQISRSDVDKLQIFELLNDHLSLGENDVKLYALSLISDILPHLSEDTDECMNSVINNIIPCLKSKKSGIRRLAIDILITYSNLTQDVQGFIRSILQNGLESVDPRVSKETLSLIPYLFTPQSLSTFREKNIYLLVAGLGRKLRNTGTRADAWKVLKVIGETLGSEKVGLYIGKLGHEQRRIYDELSRDGPELDKNTGVVGHKLGGSKGWYEYGAIDTDILSKLKDDENIRVRLTGADELNKAIRSMKDLNALLPQMRGFLNFLDSTLEEEQNFKMNLTILEIYGVLIDKLKSHKIKPHLRTVCSSLIKHTSNPNIVVRIENYRVLKKLMCTSKPTQVINQVSDHLGDKRSSVREDIINIIIFALLTFPSYEFDLKTIASTVVPTLVDPKRRVRQAALECIAVLAAFMGPSKAAPLIRSIELLESHFEKGVGVLQAVQARLSRRQLPRITSDGLVEYSVHIPTPAGRSSVMNHQNGKSYGADVDWILAGSGSLSSISAKSNNSNPHFDDSLSSSNSFPNSPSFRSSPVSIYGTGIMQHYAEDNNVDRDANRERSSLRNSGVGNRTGSRSRSEENERTQNTKSFDRSRSDLDLQGIGHRDSSAKDTKYRRAFDTVSNIEEEVESKEVVVKEDAELPRLIGTKSQASTASSSATRDSGISLNDLKLLEEHSGGGAQSGRTPRKSQLISVNDLPVKGTALPLTNRRHSLSSNKSGKSNKDSDEPFGFAESRKNSVVAVNMTGSSSTPLLRPMENSPFLSKMSRVRSEESVSTNSTAFSRPSTQSNQFEYDDDFNSDGSNLSGKGQNSRIPIKRNSSLRRKKSVMKNYINFKNEITIPINSRDRILMGNEEILLPKASEALFLRPPRSEILRSPSMENGLSGSLPHSPLSDFPKGSSSSSSNNSPLILPNNNARSSATTTCTSLSNASSVNGSSYSLKTKPTLKSPIEGYPAYKIPHPHPENLVRTTLEGLGSQDWEKNVSGLIDAQRLVVFHSEFLQSELKEIISGILKQVRNLRSQVCRLAVHVLGEFFLHVKKAMESDLEKTAGPLISKTGDTNKFLREDCHIALDHVVENLNPIKVIGFITSESHLHHKNPVIRATVSRLLAYTIERLGCSKALSGVKDLTDKLIPAVAKLAQDGSQDARGYAKSALKILIQHPDFDRILKKNLTPNNLRNLEKILDGIRFPNAKRSSGGGRNFKSNASRVSRQTY